MTPYLNPVYDYLQITDIIPSKKDIIIYLLCSITNCENPYIQISQMMIGWKPLNKTFIYEFIDIDVFKLIHKFGEAVGQGIIYELKSETHSYFQNFFTNVQTLIPNQYLNNK